MKVPQRVSSMKYALMKKDIAPSSSPGGYVKSHEDDKSLPPASSFKASTPS